jgi:hypothetical protein
MYHPMYHAGIVQPHRLRCHNLVVRSLINFGVGAVDERFALLLAVDHYFGLAGHTPGTEDMNSRYFSFNGKSSNVRVAGDSG